MKYLTNNLLQFKQWILSIVSCWISFDKKFPSIGEKVKVKQVYHTKYNGKYVYISEIFDWVIKSEDKKEWLESGLSNMYWKSYN